MSRINHKFDYITDTCKVCGVIKRTTSYVGNGYNPNLKNMMGAEYSTDGANFSKEYINCNKK